MNRVLLVLISSLFLGGCAQVRSSNPFAGSSHSPSGTSSPGGSTSEIAGKNSTNALVHSATVYKEAGGAWPEQEFRIYRAGAGVGAE